MNMWIMYLVLKLDDIEKGLRLISVVCLPIVIASLIIFIMCCIIGADSDCQEGAAHIKKTMISFFKCFVPVLAIAFLLSILTPTTKQAAAIYFVPKVINNKQVRKMPDKLVTLANSWMDEQIKSIKTK